MIKYRLAVFLLVFSVASMLFGQRSLVYHLKDKDFDKAYELFQKKKYGSARIKFNDYLKNKDGKTLNYISEAAFYEALCATKLNNEDMFYKWDMFLKDYPESNRRPYAYFYLGNYYVDHNKFTKAERLYDKVNASGLDKTTKDEYFFKAFTLSSMNFGLSRRSSGGYPVITSSGKETISTPFSSAS